MYYELLKFQKIDAVEEAFALYIVHKSEAKGLKCATIADDLKKAFTGLNQEQQEAALKHYLLLTADTSNLSRLQFLLNLIEQLVADGVLPARYADTHCVNMY
jgi:Mediator complex subunit 23